ncbi:hypothetical protein CEQ90_10190 [Lewinellaceae bacterium SD302]|nr:hypothetical protein CEQ90_10190 [Lewinellaceae bacterium SD302]
MKSILSICFALLAATGLVAQNDVVFDASAGWIGFMNVSDLPENGGAYQFGSAWEVSALKSTLDQTENTLVLQPNFNTYADNPGDPFWINADGEGNKQMEALTFVEPGETFNGSDLTFSGVVQSYTLSDDYEVKYFIKALDPNDGFSDALDGSKVFELPESGEFSVSATGMELAAGLIIQYGFSVTGRNANPANEAELGSVQIGSEVSSVNAFQTLELPVSVYPNPATDMITIATDAQVESYRVASITGQTLFSGQTDRNVDVAELAAGTYFITVVAKEGTKVVKFTKR